MGQFLIAAGTSLGGTAAAGTAVATAAEMATASSLGLGIASAAPVATGGFLGLSSATWAGISTAGSMLMNVRAGQAQQVNYQMQARQEEFAAKDREVQRRRRLIASLSSQNAARGASGVRAFEGSPASMMQSDIDLAEYDNTMADANLGMKQQSLLTSGKYAQQSGYMSAGSSLLNYGSRMAERG